MSRKVYPIEGFYLNGVPHVEHDCDDDLCVESGAFTTRKPPPEKAASTNQEPTEQVGSSDSKET